ncbi:carboxypeptidase-like regulatory domain-containing protein [Flavobacterium sp.]|uniref:carboxypeptidase-like regulatory domain-containing protein n=1 Tax=Flavobacterium sp. TaxID=239 RepID=UPI0037538173
MKYSLAFLLITCSLTAQVKGIIKDSISGKPIPFVNIWVENENIGASSEENGEFVINTSEKSKKLIFSALGFEKKILKISETSVVKLKPTAYQLDEVVVFKTLGTKVIEIGKTQSTIYQAFDNGPKIDTKYFPYLPKYKKTKYIKQVNIETDSKIDDATIRLHFYTVDANGFPGEEIIKKDFIVTVKSGLKKTFFDLKDYGLKMPKTGIFIGFEKLIIEKNKFEKTITDSNSNTTKIQKTYYPYVLYNSVEREFQFTFSGGKWNKQTKYNTDGTLAKMRINEPAINLILTN